MNDGRHSKNRRDSIPSSPQEVRGIETFGRLDDAASKKPTEHGEGADPRYPSPRRLRWISAFVVDWLLHAGPMIAVFVVLAHNPALDEKLPQARLWALISWPILSFVDRTVVQGLFHATVGKMLFGLVVIRPEDGGWPAFGRLVKVWLFGLFFWFILIISIFGNYIGGGNGGGRVDFALPAVRRNDVGTDHLANT
ncbi:RDD family protein [Nocardia terpenica]|uniref:RDD family protein n=1 Tax=Nocardia terpenica TaxID=455432 RepID=A0A291RRT4_9NOCA|nr:RDD family protein [Nocardia terpenica]